MNRAVKILIFLILITLTFAIYKYKTKESFCLDKNSGLEYESYYNTGYKPEEIYKGTTMATFLDTVKKDKETNHSILGSVQNPMSDRNYNTRILYQNSEKVYKF